MRPPDPLALDLTAERCAAEGADSLFGLTVAPWPPQQPTTFALLRDGHPTPLTSGTQPYCLQQRLRHLQSDRRASPFPNIPFPTLGGAQLWGDVFACGGYRIQQHVHTQHCRLLSPADIRLAAGPYFDCRVAFEALRLQSHIAPSARHAVVFLHGLNRTRSSMWWLARAFNQRGYETLRLNYPSTRAPIHDHATRLRLVLSRLRDIDTVSFVTHSMGGIVVRALLGLPHEPGDWRERVQIHRLLMICPPNQGSAKADRWLNVFLARALEGPALQQLTSEGILRFPTPDFPFGIIAGKNDNTVRPFEAELPEAEIYIAETGHTFAILSSEVTQAALHYIGHGAFEPPTP